MELHLKVLYKIIIIRRVPTSNKKQPVTKTDIKFSN